MRLDLPGKTVATTGAGGGLGASLARALRAHGANVALLDLTVYGRQQSWEDSPPGWPRAEENIGLRVDGRPYSQWPRIAAGRYRTRDYSPDRLRAALELFVLHFPVYRTYVSRGGASSHDRAVIAQALTAAPGLKSCPLRLTVKAARLLPWTSYTWQTGLLAAPSVR